MNDKDNPTMWSSQKPDLEGAMANNRKLTDEDAKAIAKATLDEQARREEEASRLFFGGVIQFWLVVLAVIVVGAFLLWLLVIYSQANL